MPEVLTAKGAMQADAILDAALRCLSRDGYSATSLQRVADEAGVQKRMVVYYFGSRIGLMAQVVDRIGERFLGQLDEALSGLHDPSEVLTVGLERVWSQLAGDPALQIAYTGLVAESITDPEIRERLAALRDRARVLIESALDDLDSGGYDLLLDRNSLIVLASAAAHGLGLELLLRGNTPELQRVIGLSELALQFVFERR